MTIDPNFWVAISFFIFFAVLIYLKVPQKVNNLLSNQINSIRSELKEAERLKVEAKNILSNYESKIDKSKKEVQEIINLAKKNSETIILEKTKNFHQMMENKKRSAEQKIFQMKENAIKDIRNVSIKISMQAVEHLFKNSIDKSKLEKIYSKSLEQIKTSFKHVKA
jgi:F-type H+-transporting ATPase subunit b